MKDKQMSTAYTNPIDNQNKEFWEYELFGTRYEKTLNQPKRKKATNKADILEILNITHKNLDISVSSDGFEPSTFSLRGNCSTAEL